jgi:hypothetical protein
LQENQICGWSMGQILRICSQAFSGTAFSRLVQAVREGTLWI